VVDTAEITEGAARPVGAESLRLDEGCGEGEHTASIRTDARWTNEGPFVRSARRAARALDAPGVLEGETCDSRILTRSTVITSPNAWSAPARC
jgi:hypothetical protein